MDLDNMIFLAGSEFIFGSSICKEDGDGKLQNYLRKDLASNEELDILANETD
jgi:hypothetical protein